MSLLKFDIDARSEDSASFEMFYGVSFANLTGNCPAYGNVG
jgi:hypothetical protein